MENCEGPLRPTKHTDVPTDAENQRLSKIFSCGRRKDDEYVGLSCFHFVSSWKNVLVVTPVVLETSTEKVLSVLSCNNHH